MRYLVAVILGVLLCNALDAQLNDKENNWFQQTERIIQMNVNEPTYRVKYKIRLKEFNNQCFIDSLFICVTSYINEAIKSNRSKIVVIIRTNNLFKKSIKKTFDVDALNDELNRTLNHISNAM